MTWHKPTQSFSSSDNFFKILWNDALKDEKDKTNIYHKYEENYCLNNHCLYKWHMYKNNLWNSDICKFLNREMWND